MSLRIYVDAAPPAQTHADASARPGTGSGAFASILRTAAPLGGVVRGNLPSLNLHSGHILDGHSSIAWAVSSQPMHMAQCARIARRALLLVVTALSCIFR